MIKLLVVEDSATMLEHLLQLIGTYDDLEVVGSAKNGVEAIELTRKLKPQLVLMDINMPLLNGFEATHRIMTEVPTPVVIMSATNDVHQVHNSMAALQAGALAILEKPVDVGSENFKKQAKHLIDTIRTMAEVKVVRHWARKAPPQSVAEPSTYRKVTSHARIVAIGASTGGPAALAAILANLPASFPLPILVVQHIVTGFMEGLASWLTAVSPLRICLAKGGEELRPGTVYLCGDAMQFGVSSENRISLSDEPPVGGFKPSATFLFQSVAETYGADVLALILTGMGRDGVEGLRAVQAARGVVLAQDEVSSAVWGMPAAAIEAGVVDTVLPLDEIAQFLIVNAGVLDNEIAHIDR